MTRTTGGTHTSCLAAWDGADDGPVCAHCDERLGWNRYLSVDPGAAT